MNLISETQGSCVFKGNILHGCNLFVLLLAVLWAVLGCASRHGAYSKEMCVGVSAEEKLWTLSENPGEREAFLVLVEDCAERGVAEYQILLCALMLNDTEVAEADRLFERKVRRSEALRWLERAARQKDERALDQWAAVFEEGWLDITKDPETAKACRSAERPCAFRSCLEKIEEAVIVLERSEGLPRESNSRRK